MPINPHTSAKFPLLDGVTSLLDALADPTQQKKVDAYMAWDDGYEAPAVTVADDAAQGPHGPIPVRVYRPTESQHQGEPRPALVWLHGGALLAVDLDMPEADVVARELAHRAGLVVISVDNRLAVDGVSFPCPT